MLYYDEIEICNPLGAAKKIHKLGMNIEVYVLTTYVHIVTCI